MAAASSAKVALQPVNWKTDAIALISNSKPNARELLEGIRTKLGAHRAGGQHPLPCQEQRQPARAEGSDREDRDELQGGNPSLR